MPARRTAEDNGTSSPTDPCGNESRLTDQRCELSDPDFMTARFQLTSRHREDIMAHANDVPPCERFAQNWHGCGLPAAARAVEEHTNV
jgi:hypothetical protein